MADRSWRSWWLAIFLGLLPVGRLLIVVVQLKIWCCFKLVARECRISGEWVAWESRIPNGGNAGNATVFELMPLYFWKTALSCHHFKKRLSHASAVFEVIHCMVFADVYPDPAYYQLFYAIFLKYGWLTHATILKYGSIMPLFLKNDSLMHCFWIRLSHATIFEKRLSHATILNTALSCHYFEIQLYHATIFEYGSFMPLFFRPCQVSDRYHTVSLQNSSLLLWYCMVAIRDLAWSTIFEKTTLMPLFLNTALSDSHALTHAIIWNTALWCHYFELMPLYFWKTALMPLFKKRAL